MPSYRIEKGIIELTLPPTYELAELRALFETIREDPALPARAAFLVDARARTEVPSDREILGRIRALIDPLYPGMLPVCAVVVTNTLMGAAVTARELTSEIGIRMGIFTDPIDARRWLSVYLA